MPKIDPQIFSQANRCLNCKNANCKKNCPVGQNIPHFLNLVKAGQFEKAYDVIVETNPLASICGQVCPHQNQCMGNCILAKKSTAVNIGGIESYITKHFRQKFQKTDDKLKQKNIAIVGSGPAGLAAAWFLLKHNANVTIFEKNPQLGGVLRYGIPNFRLDKSCIDDICADLISAGAKFLTNTQIGKDMSLAEVSKKFHAVFLACGLQNNYDLDIDGQNLFAVVQGIDLLHWFNTKEKKSTFSLADILACQHKSTQNCHQFDQTLCSEKIQNAIVIGGGNTAIDCARVAAKFCQNVTIAYRRTEAQMPALKEEIEQAKAEGINFEFLLTPTKINSNTSHPQLLDSVQFQQNVLGEIGSDGRQTFVATDKKITLDCQLLIVGIGSFVDQTPFENTDIKLQNGKISADKNLLATGNIFVGGDILNRQNTVSAAVYDAKQATDAIFNWLLAEK